MDLEEASNAAKRRVAMQDLHEKEASAEVEPSTENEPCEAPLFRSQYELIEKVTDHSIDMMIDFLRLAKYHPFTDKSKASLSELKQQYLDDIKAAQFRFEEGLKELDKSIGYPSQNLQGNTTSAQVRTYQLWVTALSGRIRDA
jgi:hypothetical protein